MVAPMIAIPLQWVGAVQATADSATDFTVEDPPADRPGEIGSPVSIRSASIRTATVGSGQAARAAEPADRPGTVPDRGRLLGLGLAIAGCCVILWIGVLAAQVPPLAEPSNWNAAWIGLDALEAAGLLSTGLLLRRRDPRMCLTAAATAMLLFMDAWFDIMTAAPADRPLAIAMAVAAELPIGSVCAGLALRRM